MFLHFRTRLLLAGVFMAGIVAVSWHYLESDSAAPPLSTATSPRPEASNAIAVTEPVKPVAISSPSHTPFEGVKSSGSAPLSLNEAMAVASRFERHQLLERFGFEAAKEGSEAALRRLSEIPGEAEQAAFLRGMFAELAEYPAEAFRAVKSLAEGIDRETAVAALVAHWRTGGPLPVNEQASLTRNFGAMGGMLASLLGDPVLTADCARELLSGMDRARLLGAASGRLAASDPQQALALGSELAGRERAEFLVGLASGWARTAGDAAWAWALQQPDPGLRESLQEAVMASWAPRDPAAAASLLPQITNAESRKKLLADIAGWWAGADTKAAIDWANNLGTPQERETATAAIRENAPVGIGVVLADGPDGYPLIRELVPGSTASASGVLQDGYQIAAVGQGNGQFTDLQGKNIGDIAPLIRGKPGSSVWLQVIPPGGSPTNRLTVVVPRQQLMFKKPPGS
jgi:hypothetical protein